MLAGLLVPLVMLSLSPPAHAEPCPVTEPDCLIDAAEETTETVEDTVASAVDDGQEAVKETQQSVEEAADQVVGQVEEVVDGLEGKKPGEEGGEGKRDRPDRAGTDGPSDAVHTGARPTAGSFPPRRVLRLAEPSRPPSFVRAPHLDPVGSDSTLAGRAIEAAKRLAFPAVLLLIVAGFLALQNRIDRSDPKLTLAAELPDHLPFQ